MIIVIDGYNLLKQIKPQVQISEYERSQFIGLLSRYAQQKGHKVVLVFDAGPFERSIIEKKQAVSIVYSGTLETADDYIRLYIDTHKAQDIFLVTSDRELRRYANHQSIESIDSLKFYATLQQSMSPLKQFSPLKKTPIKTSAAEDSAVDELMMQTVGVVPCKQEDSHMKQKRISESHQLSKKERKLLQKIKKL